MMAYYFVKRPLYGIEAGRVERFALHKAGPLMAQGDIEPYDPTDSTHQIAPGAPPEGTVTREVRRSESKRR